MVPVYMESRQRIGQILGMELILQRPRAGSLTSLEAGQVFSIRPWRSRGLTLVSGQVWVTIEGDPVDYLLLPGERLDLPAGRRAVVQALAASTIRA